MKKLLMLMIAMVFLLSACGGGKTTKSNTVKAETNTTSNTEEVEDCDFDDLVEGDEDCYGVDLEKKKTKVKSSVTAPAVKKPKVKTVKPKVEKKIVKPSFKPQTKKRR